jgi:catechol 2,3-dioxygenase-like lactoylglutathione lyase family enzyme
VHLAFLVPAGALEGLAERLRAAGIGLVNEQTFGAGQRSLFVDDPDGNVIELADWARSWEGLPVER